MKMALFIALLNAMMAIWWWVIRGVIITRRDG